jgi:type II secretory pathway component PulL
MMKQIGFLDIHPDSLLCGKHVAASNAEGLKDDPSVMHIFRKNGNEYIGNRTLPYSDQEALEGIDEFYVSIPLTILDFRILNFPFSDREKIRKIIPFELDMLIMSGSGDIVFDTIILANTGEAVEVLVAYLSKEVLQELLARLSGLKIDPQIVTSIDLQDVVQALREKREQCASTSLAELLENPMNLDIPRRLEQAKQEISSPLINLRSGPFSYRKDTEKTKRAFRLTVFLSILLAVIIHTGLITQTMMLKRETSSISHKMRSVYTHLFPTDRKVIDELYQLKSRYQGMKEKNTLLTGLDPLRFLADLSQRMEPNVAYTDIYLEKGLIKMKAEARSMDDLSNLSAKLSGFLSGVSISDVRPTDQGKVLFTVIAKEYL